MAAPNLHSEIGTALYSTLNGGTALAAVATGGAWNTSAGDTPPTAPYLVFSFVGSTDDDMIGTDVDVMDWQVVAYDNQPGADRAGTVAAEAHALLHDKQLSMTNFTNTGTYRVGRIHQQDPDGWWNVGATYRIRASKAK